MLLLSLNRSRIPVEEISRPVTPDGMSRFEEVWTSSSPFGRNWARTPEGTPAHALSKVRPGLATTIKCDKEKRRS